MNYAPIITSMIDTDAYKLTMAQVVNRHFPNVCVQYDFINRSNTVFPNGFGDLLKQQVQMMSSLNLQSHERDWLKSIRYMKPTFIDWLAGYRYNPNEVQIHQNDVGNLFVRVLGPWYRTIFWEVLLLATISELYYKMMNITPENGYSQKIIDKTTALNNAGVYWADFGTRRRFSYDVQDAVVKHMAKKPGFLGTSNPYLAMKYDVKPIGTYAHECVMAMQASFGFINCNRAWMDAWVKEYEGDLGIVLPDTVTSEFFFKHQFSMFYAKLFDGSRQDSGDPNKFADMAIARYKELNIDPKSKRIVFSDGLDVKRGIALCNEWKNKVMPSLGIGTHLTNDVGVKPLSIVMKMTAADFGRGMTPVVKLSDDSGKYTGNPDTIVMAKKQLLIS